MSIQTIWKTICGYYIPVECHTVVYNVGPLMCQPTTWQRYLIQWYKGKHQIWFLSNKTKHSVRFNQTGVLTGRSSSSVCTCITIKAGLIRVNKMTVCTQSETADAFFSLFSNHGWSLVGQTSMKWIYLGFVTVYKAGWQLLWLLLLFFLSSVKDSDCRTERHLRGKMQIATSWNESLGA